ncbi:MAG: transglutaminase domain-containing protein [Deltaproteobacteria bacterium]|nr:transglutaminase domain-containing protein [Deltaproteobacteria bacterium]
MPLPYMFYRMLVKRSIGLAIVLFWCLMNFLLLKRQWWIAPAPINLRAVEAITETSEEWWSIHYRGEKIGYASQIIEPKAPGYRLKDESLLRLNLLGTSQTAATRLSMEVDKEWVLENFDFDLQSNELRFRARGRVAPGKLMLEVISAGNSARHELPLTQPPYLSAALKPLAATQQLEPGKEHFFLTFDPATLSNQLTSLTIEGREEIRLGDRIEPATRIRQRYKGLSIVSWIDGQGRTLKEESPGGFSIVRANRQEARSLDGSRSVPLDLISQTAVRPNAPIADPETKETLRLKLSGFDFANFALHGGRQRLGGDRLEIRREIIDPRKSFSVPLRAPHWKSYLQPTVFLQSDHPEIRSLAAKIIAGETDARKAAVRIKDWVYREIAKVPTVSVPNSLEVLKTKKGDCNEHTVLFNALARAAGIPARTAVGVVYLRDAFYYHAWSEVWLGEWISLDSVLDQFPADVTHIKFLEGDIDRQIDILQLIGNLKIEVLDGTYPVESPHR